MSKKIHKQNTEFEKESFFDRVAEWIGWMQIVASPLLGGLILGGVINLWMNNTAGMIVGGFIALAGLVAGILMANRVKKKSGTIYFMSRVNASPETDNLQTRIKKV